jgi:hypothetical protein
VLTANVNDGRISLTARLAAYMRQFTDIPFARDVAQYLHAREAFELLLRDHDMKPDDLLWYAPIFEVRYKSIRATLRNLGATQVLELASGLSLRGLSMTQERAITYVESDLADLTAEKVLLVDALRRQYVLADHGNHHLVSANALNLNELQSATQSFRRDQPVAVVHEGLLQYLSPTEMATVARNIRALLDEFGGVWITPDFSFRQTVQDVTEQQKRFRRVVAAATDRAMYNNAFDDEAQLRTFLGGLGLRARVLNQVDVAPDVVSMGALNLAPEVLERAKPGLRLWVITAGES